MEHRVGNLFRRVRFAPLHMHAPAFPWMETISSNDGSESRDVTKSRDALIAPTERDTGLS